MYNNKKIMEHIVNKIHEQIRFDIFFLATKYLQKYLRSFIFILIFWIVKWEVKSRWLFMSEVHKNLSYSQNYRSSALHFITIYIRLFKSIALKLPNQCCAQFTQKSACWFFMILSSKFPQHQGTFDLLRSLVVKIFQK